MSLGEKIKTGRAARKMSQSELADAIGVGRSTVAKYESGEKTPSLGTFAKMRKALKWTRAESYTVLDCVEKKGVK